MANESSGFSGATGSGGSGRYGGSLLKVFEYMQWEQLVAGVSGGVASTLVLHPLDLVKVRLQVNEGGGITNRPQYTSLLNAFSSIIRQQGMRGLYQGVTPNVWGAGTSWGLYFFWYSALKSRSRQGDSTVQLSSAQNMICAAQAGFLTLIITNPLWVMKVRLCLQYDQAAIRYHGMWDCLRKTYHGEGLRGLYKGFTLGIFGISHGALQFMAYEALKVRYNAYRNMPAHSKFGTFEYLCMAAMSKIFAASATYPYQVVRARLQDQHRQYNGAIDVITQTFRHEGFKGFYKGMVPGIIRVTPACCVTFVVYEKVSELLLRHSSFSSANNRTSSTDTSTSPT